MVFNVENGRDLLQGLLLGLSIAAPVGPIALLCIRRTLDRGFMSGLVSGLGAAMALTRTALERLGGPLTTTRSRTWERES